MGRLGSSCSITQTLQTMRALLKRTNDLSALILRRLLSAVSIQHGPQQVLGRFGRLSVELRWEDSRATSQAVQSSRRRSQIVRSNLGKSLPDNDYPALTPLCAGIWISPWFIAVFWRDNSINGNQAKRALAQPIFDFLPKLRTCWSP